MAIDPVCGMTVDPARAAGHVDYKGTTYHFCSQHCVHAFQADPEKFLSKKDKAEKPADMGAQYTCPMHPEVVQLGPGSCPKCGMALVPMEGAAEDDSELRDLKRRLWVSAALGAPLVVIAMAPMFGFGRTFPFLQLVLATPVILWGGWPFFYKFWLSIKNRSPNMYTLIGLGVGAAYVFSVVALFVPGMHGDQGEVQSRIIMTAAKKGFASGGYGEIHQDYSEVVEDALEKEHIPAGKRTYVRRYFDLIRPR